MDSNSNPSDIPPVEAEQPARYALSRWRSSAGELYRWWRQELREMVPAGWRLWAAPRLRVEATMAELTVFNPPQPEPIDRVPLGEPVAHGLSHDSPVSRCELVLGSELGLITPITLPDAAEVNLREVIGFSMDRYTPFREAEVYFDVRITRRDRSNHKLDLMLYVVPRATLARLSEHLAAMGLDAVLVDIIDSHQEPPVRAGINLLPPLDNGIPARRARLNGGLAFSALLLLLTVLAIPVYQRHQTLRSLEQELEALRMPVHEAERLREDVNHRSETLRIIMERRNGAPPALELLRELTRLTPDEAWAGQLEIKNGRLRITGEAAAGSDLLQALTGSGLFTDPRFEAPLTQNPKSGRERFVISLAIKERVYAP